MADIDTVFWNIFQQVLDLESCVSAHYSSADTEEWDSLKHVELIFELEQSFSIDISPDDIVELFSDTTTVMDYLKRKIEQ